MKTMKRDNDILLAAGILLLGMAAFVWAQGGGFQFFGPLSRVLTPNGDGRNDYVLFCYDNPSDSDVSGKIYTLLGAYVADLGAKSPLTSPPPGGAGAVACPGGFLPQYSYWDGRMGGATVHSGVYIYQIRAEGQVFKGTLLVVR